MDLPKLEDLDFQGKKVLVRADLDMDVSKGDQERLKALLPTLKYLSEKASKIIIIGHRGRPASTGLRRGKPDGEFSLKPISDALRELLIKEWGKEKVEKLNMFMMENLRFDKGEEENDEHYAKHLAEKGDVFVNEAFAASHRKHASVVSLPKLLPHAAGFHFQKEIENLSKVLENPKRPVLAIIGGLKKDKLNYVEDFKRFADEILVAGRLAEYITDEQKTIDGKKVLVAELTAERKDISVDSIEKFTEKIAKAETIIIAGPMGKFEEDEHRMGTEKILQAIADSSVFKVVGGGETERAIGILGLRDRFDWISVGGGAMLEYLAKGTLPGIEALLN